MSGVARALVSPGPCLPVELSALGGRRRSSSERYAAMSLGLVFPATAVTLLGTGCRAQCPVTPRTSCKKPTQRTLGARRREMLGEPSGRAPHFPVFYTNNDWISTEGLILILQRLLA